MEGWETAGNRGDMNSISILILFCAVVIVGCTSEPGDRVNASLLEAEKQHAQIPSGRELKIAVEKLDPNKFDVTITNVSIENVFCSFLPGEHGNNAEYFPYMVEVRQQPDSEFTFQSKGGHYAPSLRPILPGEQVRFTFFSLEPGEYRLSFRYLVDDQLAKLINENAVSPGLTSAESEAVEKATFVVHAPIMNVAKR